MDELPSTHKNIYDQVAEISEIFKKEKYLELRQKPIQQIWRDHLLSISMYKSNSDYENGFFVFLFPKNNIKCKNAVELYKETLVSTDESIIGFYDIIIEDFVDIVSEITNDKWVADFIDRYLNFEKIANLELQNKNNL